jgi:hypothetical protein
MDVTMSALDQAIELGEKAVAEAILLRERERQLLEVIRRARFMLRSGRPALAYEILNEGLHRWPER